MIFNVPQFIDIEDKLVGPLTAKQLGWLAAGGVTLLVLYGILDQSAFLISAIITAVIFCALAFYRPYNQPLIKFITSSILFVTRPKMYIWRRAQEKIQKAAPTNKDVAPTKGRKNFDAQKAAELSKLLDMNKS